MASTTPPDPYKSARDLPSMVELLKQLKGMKTLTRFVARRCDVQVVWTALWHQVNTLITDDRPILSKADRLRELGIEAQSPTAFAANL